MRVSSVFIKVLLDPIYRQLLLHKRLPCLQQTAVFIALRYLTARTMKKAKTSTAWGGWSFLPVNSVRSDKYIPECESVSTQKSNRFFTVTHSIDMFAEINL